jgi:crotonobetainyl-CoA:carnitine CoA-transferase CaiB-like acyl-CoA transferase
MRESARFPPHPSSRRCAESMSSDDMERTMPPDAVTGYRILDFGTAFASPMAAHLLADMGAEVIKVESHTRLDGLRLGRPIVGEDIAGGDRGEWPEYQPVFHGLNRSKLGITVNIKHPEGVELLKRLVRISDVVINNFSPGVMDRTGLGYDVLRAEKPDLIYVSLPAAGDSGPLRDIVTYAPVIAALAGISGLVGYSAAREDFVGTLQVALCDAVGALHAVVAILAALRHRQATGEGQAIEIAQWEAAVSMLGEGLLDYVMNGRVLRPVGNAHPHMVPHENYRCAGDDAWVAIAVRSEDEWRAFCGAVGHPEWIDCPRFADAYRRRQHRSELDAMITSWTSQRAPYEVMETLQAAGVAAMPVMNLDDQFRDPHLREREIHLESDHPKVGLEFLHGIPWRLSGTPGRIRRPAPLLGEHNQYVFGDLLGLPDAEIQRLMQTGAID